jgi:adenylosuccinate synthase
MPATIILGGQWGDEGKGKITDALAVEGGVVVRANGGSNAGHTIQTPDGVFKMHLIPSGILNPDCQCVIGAGVVIDPFALRDELQSLNGRGVDTRNLLIAERAHVVLPIHAAIDRREEELRGSMSIGTTLRGIGPAYSDKVSRRGIRVVDLQSRSVLEERVAHQFRMHGTDSAGNDRHPSADQVVRTLLEIGEELAPWCGPAETIVQDALDEGKNVIIECAQGTMLDIDYGTYPFVTSSSPTAAGACQGAGVAPTQVTRVIGVFKAYSTRVGSGPMPAELEDETGQLIRERGKEYGTTTGRPRRTGWFDAVAARQAVRLNGVSEIALTLVDVFDTFPEISMLTSYRLDGDTLDRVPADLEALARVEPAFTSFVGWQSDTTGVRSAADLPENALAYIDAISQRTGARVSMVGVGPSREQLVPLPKRKAPKSQHPLGVG